MNLGRADNRRGIVSYNIRHESMKSKAISNKGDRATVSPFFKIWPDGHGEQAKHK